MTRRKVFDDTPRPLTANEAAIASRILGETVTPKWFGRKVDGVVQILRPPKVPRHRLDLSNNVAAWQSVPVPQLGDAMLCSAMTAARMNDGKRS